MDKPEAVRVGVVGCGNHGGALAQAVVRSDTLRLVACADPDPAAVRRVAGLSDAVSAYASLEALLDASDVDAVLIATPHEVLAPLALSAIRAGKHLLIEKPMAMDEPQGKEVEFAAASAGVTCMVGYSFRYGMARYVHELLSQGAVGDFSVIIGSIGTPPMNTSLDCGTGLWWRAAEVCRLPSHRPSAVVHRRRAGQCVGECAISARHGSR
jgi:predicted dehydrogenase